MTRMPVQVFPEPIAEFIGDGAAALTCDPSYVAVPMLPALASAIGNTRRIRLKADWSEPAVIWAAPVGDSGTVKSPAQELALKPVWRRQKALLKDHREAHAQYDDELQDWKDTPKKDRGDKPDAPPACQHPLCIDITVEGLADRLQATPRGVLVAPDELGAWFGSFTRYKSSSDVSHWLSMFGARALKVDRKNAERPTIYIPQAAVSVTGGIQPATLSRALIPEFFENGLAARLLVAMPPSQPKRWTDREIPEVTRTAVDRVFDALYDLKQDPGTDGEDAPRMVDLTPSALDLWKDWVNEIGEQAAALSGPSRAALAKLEAYAARFALVFHCVRQASGEKSMDYVDDGDVTNGCILARWFGAEVQRVYHLMSESDEDRDRRELIELIMRLGWRVTSRDLQKHCRKYPKSEDANAALQALVDASDGNWETPRTGRAGRLATFFCLAETPDRIRSKEAWTVDTNPGIRRENAIVSTSTPNGAGKINGNGRHVAEGVGR